MMTSQSHCEYIGYVVDYIGAYRFGFDYFLETCKTVFLYSFFVTAYLVLVYLGSG